jgi:hypothetical protein
MSDFNKRIAIFAHFDKEQLIDEYVVNYLLGLAQVSGKIIFVSDGDLAHSEREKISIICSDVIAVKHGEYDFGSYKRGFNLLKDKYLNELNATEEIIFANDSCYLIKDLTQVFEDMSKKCLDFWGIAESFQYGHNHVHSYFFVVGSKAFKDKGFDGFLNNVKKENSIDDVIEKYEVGLTKALTERGFRVGSFFGQIFFKDISNQKILKRLISEGYPFLKIKILVLACFTADHFKDFVSDKNLKIINNNLVRRIGLDNLLRVNHIFNHFSRYLIHKKLFLIRLKYGKLFIKLFGIQILKIDLNSHFN